ncbi:RNA polymerase sigma factor [Bdellovibrionales bacterium]|nr:RNA polymerase sigma factor [Bdellovibrionales bacterium]
MENSKNISWEPILKKMNNGDKVAVNSFILNSEAKLYKFCLFYIGSDELAKDVLQETYLKIFEKKVKFDTERSPLPLLKTIAKNIYLDLVKKSSYAKIHISSSQVDETIFGSVDSLQEREKLLDIVKLLSKLSEEERIIIILIEIEGHTYRDAAEVAGITEESLRMKLHRARKTILAINKSETVSPGQSYIRRSVK